MGYDLHITRAPDWANNVGLEIRSSEWMAVVREDPDLIEDPFHGPCSVVWKGPAEGERGWFDWSDGNIYTTDASRDVLLKMLQIADQLHARVQGDDGESYGGDGQPVVRQTSR